MSALINQARMRAPRIAEAAVDRARLTVVPRRRTRAPRVPFVMLVSLLLVLGVAGLLTFNTSMQQASFAATALETRADALAAREQSLRMELEQLRDPQRLAVQARDMGMVAPSSPTFLRLSDGKVLGPLVPAGPTDGVRVTPLPAVLPANLRPRKVIVPAPAPAHTDRSGRHGAADPAAGDRTGTKKQQQDQQTGQQGE
ncbi:hypothetical protein [Nocardioides mesophilus]|uniref:Cell division protein FtsL n=1 Tax=Nocardioides mesophilus TaxID=433659 RepID=A0A7G9RBX1_9ACTN|nr:hypothetical protein [Nocardioides mesophilus]QNN53096.1 hypothetical protein H9L09_00910 [Nocardioides mesophilus]